MVHAYEHVRCTKGSGWRDCHDEYFSTKIDVVHQRALRTLGINAIGQWETYRQSHWFKGSVDDSYINRALGPYDSNTHDDRYKDDYGKYGSTRDGRGRRDERRRPLNADKGGSNSKVNVVACSVM